MSTDDVRAYYAGFGEREWARLDASNPDGAVEFALTTHTIAALLPPASRVLDLGAGPGRYSLWLAERGHRVTVADLSPELLSIAREKIAASPVGHMIEEIVEADARDLGHWPDVSFDAVLSLGPFYHLTAIADRARAADEMARVVRPGGLIFAALMPRLVFLRRTMAIPDERRHLADPTFVARLLEQGVFLNDVPGRFSGGYGVRPEEVAPFFEGYGFETLALLADIGISTGLNDALAEMAATEPEAYQHALRLVIQTAGEPSILGLSNHLLYAGKRAR